MPTLFEAPTITADAVPVPADYPPLPYALRRDPALVSGILFRGLASLPDVDRVIDSISKSLLAEGVQAALDAGARLSPDGPLVCSPSTRIAGLINRGVAKASRIQWTDQSGCRWALRIDPDHPDRGFWHATALTMGSDCRLLDPNCCRGLLRHSIRGRLSEIVSTRKRQSKRDAQRRTEVARQVRIISSICAANRLLDWLSKQPNAIAGMDVIAEPRSLAAVIWGDDAASWPVDWYDQLLESMGALSKLGYARIRIPKLDWTPEFITVDSAVQSAIIRDDQLVIRMAPSIFEILPQFELDTTKGVRP